MATFLREKKKRKRKKKIAETSSNFKKQNGTKIMKTYDGVWCAPFVFFNSRRTFVVAGFTPITLLKKKSKKRKEKNPANNFEKKERGGGDGK